MSAVQENGSESEVVRNALTTEYEVLEELGRGGMAVVFKAREKLLDRLVAIKVLPLSLAFDAEFVERFQREARTAAKLEHPNIIPIYRVGQANRVSYFVMKYLRGKPLSRVIEENGSLAPAEIRRFLIQTASALGYAHKHQIVHRDIKPDNIMFDEAGRAVVTDFGIAKAVSGSRLTGTGMSIGTPHYMSPEQARAKEIDGRSDIYSLGVVAYQCLTGRVPFDGEDAFAIGYKHVMDPLPTPTLNTAEQRELFGVIRRMLAKAPRDRFQTAQELVEVLERQTAGRGATPSVNLRTHVSTPTPTTPIPRIEPKPTARPPYRKPKRSGVLVGFLFLVMLGSGGAGGYWYLLLGSPGPLSFPDVRPTLRQAWVAIRGQDAVAQVPMKPAPLPVDSSYLASTFDSILGNHPDTPSADSAMPTVSDSTVVASDSVAPELPTTGMLEIRGVPGLGKVTLDGQDVTGHVLTVPVGSHHVRVSALGYDDYTATVAVGRGERIIVQVAMRRAAARRATQPRNAFSSASPADACDVPGSAYNAAGSCYDTPPVTTAKPVVVLPAGVKVAPPPAILWLRIEADGRVDRITPAGKTDLRFARQAAQMAKAMSFQPAQKNGEPVAAWIRMTFEGEPGL